MSLIKIAENKTQEVISCLSDHKSVAQILMKKNDVKKLLRIVIEMLLTALWGNDVKTKRTITASLSALSADSITVSAGKQALC